MNMGSIMLRTNEEQDIQIKELKSYLNKKNLVRGDSGSSNGLQSSMQRKRRVRKAVSECSL